MVTRLLQTHLRKNRKLQLTRFGPLVESLLYDDTNDPCPVFDGKMWHIFGSGGTSTQEKWHILHATAGRVEGPWEIQPASQLIAQKKVIKQRLENPHVAAPGVWYEKETKQFHMFVQTDCFAPLGTIEHLVSSDRGKTFVHRDTALSAIPSTREAGIYDPHPACIQAKDGKQEYYLTYVGFPDTTQEKNHTDIYLAKSASSSWDGPWIRLGVILRQEEVNHHNQSHHPEYEWGMEGPQLVALPSGKILLNAVCFLPTSHKGQRQRVFFAVADHVQGPYRSLGVVLDPLEMEWESGENGHAAAVIVQDKLYLFYQTRPREGRWRYGVAHCLVQDLEAFIVHHHRSDPLSLLQTIFRFTRG